MTSFFHDRPDYESGTNITLTAEPAEGWRFVRWQGSASGNTNPLQVTVTGEMNIVAVFEEIQYVYLRFLCGYYGSVVGEAWFDGKKIEDINLYPDHIDGKKYDRKHPVGTVYKLKATVWNPNERKIQWSFRNTLSNEESITYTLSTALYNDVTLTFPKK